MTVGARIRHLSLSGEWLDDPSADEREDVLPMIAGVLEVGEIGGHGRP